MLQDAWLLASIDYQAPHVRSGHILLALMSRDETARMLTSGSDSFKRISVETLQKNLPDLMAGSEEDKSAAHPSALETTSGEKKPSQTTEAPKEFS